MIVCVYVCVCVCVCATGQHSAQVINPIRTECKSKYLKVKGVLYMYDVLICKGLVRQQVLPILGLPVQLLHLRV